jgi:hypothetical protein
MANRDYIGPSVVNHGVDCKSSLIVGFGTIFTTCNNVSSVVDLYVHESVVTPVSVRSNLPEEDPKP